MPTNSSNSTNSTFSLVSKIIVVLMLSFYFALFFLYEQHITNFDYGKLVKYGEVIINNNSVFNTNYFSYTHPDYPFINHHWGTGVIFYLVYQVGGLNGLTILAMLLNLSAFLLIFTLSVRKGNFWATVFVVLLLIPLLTSRNQPRPEAFSIFFFALTLFLLVSYYNKQINIKYLWLLPIVQLLWVNIHILFFLGIFLQGVFLFQLFINKTNRKEIIYFGLVTTISILICFINPAGIKGVLYPFQIMKDIHYGVTENSPLFMIFTIKGNDAFFYYYELVFLVSGIFLYYWVKNYKEVKPYIFIIIWTLAFFALNLWRVRAGVFFVYVIVVLSSITIGQFPASYTKLINKISYGLITVLIFFIIRTGFSFYFPYAHETPGLGIDKKLDDGAAYFKNNNLHGPIFNNFDVGDYLIYYLFPKEKVFVDSRPEAYPPGFFNDKLLPAINTQKGWLDLDHEYDFNVVFLGYHPQVKGLVSRLFNDSRWFLAFSDEYTIIFLKMNNENKNLVRKELQNRKALDTILLRFEITRLSKGNFFNFYPTPINNDSVGNSPDYWDNTDLISK